MKIAVAQLNSSDDINQNLMQMSAMIQGAAAEKPDIIFFPENSLFFRLKQDEKVQPVRLTGPEIIQLQLLSNKTNVAIHFTSAIEDDETVFNASVLIRPGQDAEIVYKKMHLFDIALHGQKPIRESDSFKHGSAPNIFELGGLKFGSSICYDVRFAELYSRYAREQVEVILVPAAFLVKTGQAHWEVLLRARAIESQCYIVASAQAGVHRSRQHSQTRETYGHSMVVDPWGHIVQNLTEGVGIFYYEISKAEIEKVRQQIPMHQHRRNLF
jgi:predicted amidohydrolase